MKISAVLSIQTKVALLAVTLVTLPMSRAEPTPSFTFEAVLLVALELVVSGMALFAHLATCALVALIGVLVASIVLQVVALIAQLTVLV